MRPRTVRGGKEALMESRITPNPLIAEIVGSDVMSVFASMEVAEEEIAAAKKRHPLAVDLVDRVFKHACPNDLLRGKAQRVYRSHVQELCERAYGQHSLIPATRVEVLCALHRMTLSSRLVPDAEFLYATLFSEIMDCDIEWRGEESYPGSCGELISEMQRKLSSPKRA